MPKREFDVVVVGAGTAGANAGYQFARRGRRVLLVERRSADMAGAQWINGVLDRHFVRAGLAPPSGPERGPEAGAVHLRARHPRVGPTLPQAPTVGADMALLGQRLRKLAADAGAEIVDQVGSFEVGVEPRSGRIRTLTLRRDGQGSPTTVSASLVVDASGRTGAVRRHAPDLTPWCPTLSGDELCSASDVHHEVADTGGAAAFLRRHGAEPGDAVSFVGVSGGFSTCAVTVSTDLTRVGILVGCLANGRYGTGPRMVAEMCRHEPWIGPVVATGTGVIPLRRPYARTTAAGVALVGDAACQVFPAHGSGIGIGLVAGTMLAEGVASVDDPGDPHALWSRYQAPFQRELGGDLAGYDVLRRATTKLGGSGVDALIRSGLIGQATAQAGLEQRWATPPPHGGGARRGAARSQPAPGRGDGSRAGPCSGPPPARSPLPRTPRRPGAARWERRTVRLLGPLPR